MRLRLSTTLSPLLRHAIMKLGLFYGSSTGATAWAAELLRAEIGSENLAGFGDIRDVEPGELCSFDTLILGAPTWYVGELQEDWQEALERLAACDLRNTRVVLFGLGDAKGYPTTFLDGLGALERGLAERGARVGFGHWPTEGYEFESSQAVRGTRFCGLALDVENESWLTAPRVRGWCRQLRRELGLPRRARRAMRGVPAAPVRLRR